MLKCLIVIITMIIDAIGITRIVMIIIVTKKKN